MTSRRTHCPAMPCMKRHAASTGGAVLSSIGVQKCCLALKLGVWWQAKAKIMVVRDVERDEIEFISKTLGCLPISHADHMRPDKLGHADLVEAETVLHETQMKKLPPPHLPSTVAYTLLITAASNL